MIKDVLEMDWIQFTIFLLGNMIFTLTLCLWNRTESNADRREMYALSEAIRQDAKEFWDKWALESKDFHGRLERQDAEFKAGLLLLEQKIKK
jgi:hypothetical protein